MSVKKIGRFIWHLPANSARFLIHLYQHSFSLAIGPRCKYYPSCSHYADLALAVHGLGKGLLLTGWRLMRCNPLSDGGVDYPPVRGSWTNPWTHPGSVTTATYGWDEATAARGHKQGVLPCC